MNWQRPIYTVPARTVFLLKRVPVYSSGGYLY